VCAIIRGPAGCNIHQNGDDEEAMNANINFDQCLTFLNTNLAPRARPVTKTTGPRFRSVTLSRQTGSGGTSVATRLTEILNSNNRKAGAPWTVFDKNLVDRVLADHQLPGRLAKFFPEDRLTMMQDIMDEVFGLRPASWTVVQHTSDTMLKLAVLGNVVLIGRGGNLVARKLPDALHVRLVGSLETRARRMAEVRGMTRKSALDLIEREDVGRRRYVSKYFKADIDDPLLYHLVINTDVVTFDEAAATLARIVAEGF
jgi:cytidylate kinase